MKKTLMIFPLLFSTLCACSLYQKKDKVILELRFSYIENGVFVDDERSFSVYTSFKTNHKITNGDIRWLESYSTKYKRHYYPIDRENCGCKELFIGFYLNKNRTEILSENYVLTKDIKLYFFSNP